MRISFEALTEVTNASALVSTPACPQAASFLLFRGPGWDGGIQKVYSQLLSTERPIYGIAQLQFIINNNYFPAYGTPSDEASVWYTYSSAVNLHCTYYIKHIYVHSNVYVCITDTVYRTCTKLAVQCGNSSILVWRAL